MQLVPNIDDTEGHKIKTRIHLRQMSVIDRASNKQKLSISLQENEISLFWPCLFN